MLKYVIGWVVATAAIAFVYISLGGFLGQAGLQALGIHLEINNGWSLAAAIAIVLISGFQAAVLVGVVSVFLIVIKGFRDFDMR